MSTDHFIESNDSSIVVLALGESAGQKFSDKVEEEHLYESIGSYKSLISKDTPPRKVF